MEANQHHPTTSVGGKHPQVSSGTGRFIDRPNSSTPKHKAVAWLVSQYDTCFGWVGVPRFPTFVCLASKSGKATHAPSILYCLRFGFGSDVNYSLRLIIGLPPYQLYQLLTHTTSLAMV